MTKFAPNSGKIPKAHLSVDYLYRRVGLQRDPQACSDDAMAMTIAIARTILRMFYSARATNARN
jgi:hypothetical protein